MHARSSSSPLTKHLLVLCLLSGLWASQNHADSSDGELVLGVHPYLQQSELQKRFSPIANYLSQKLGIPVRVRVGQNYDAHIHAIGNNRIDIAYIGPGTYVEMVEKYGAKPILARLEADGEPTFQGHIVVHHSSTIRQLRDLKDKVFAFGDPQSTMSSLVPKALLRQAGVSMADLAAYSNYKGHTNVAMAVLAGDVDAGAVKEEIYHRFNRRGLRSIKATPAISEHLFVTSSTLPQQTIHKLRKLLLALNTHDTVKTVLRPIKKTATALVSAQDSDYDNLRALLRIKP